MTRRDGLFCFALAAATLAAYAGVLSSDFIRFDDPRYVSENPSVRAGLTADGVVWAFTSLYKSNWHPLTWLSHMLDVELYGLEPGGHHATSLFLHLLNSILLFGFLRCTTRTFAPSALVAALFALHPSHVESVAWVAERKDVLSTLFWLLAMSAYVGYARRGGRARYALTALCLALGLMTKPMLVTLPCVLLLLDHWPLGRMRLDRSGLRLVLEKLPLLTLAAACAAVTWVAQQCGGALVRGEGFPFADRLANAVMAYGLYVWKTLWPAQLALVYPHPNLPGGRPWVGWEVGLVGAGLGAVTLAVVWAQRRPYLAVGWFWFLGTLVPVIGLIQVGVQAMADRYTYVACIGLYVMAAFGAADLVHRFASGGRARLAAALQTASVVWIAALAVVSWRQVGYWRDSVTLFEHSLAVAPGSYVLHNNLGNVLFDQGLLDASIREYRRALEINPDYARAHGNLRNALGKKGEFYEAAQHHLRASGIEPGSLAAELHLGAGRLQQGESDAALAHFRRALEMAPSSDVAHLAAGRALLQLGRNADALRHHRRAVEIAPDSVAARRALGQLLLERGDLAEAIRHYREVVRLAPNSADDRARLAQALRAKAQRAPSSGAATDSGER